MEKEKLATNSSINLYQHVTDKIIEALEQGVGPWIRPWDNSDAQFGIQRNGFTGRPYHGVNVLLLNLKSLERGFSDPRWVTFSDVQRLGGYIKKDEHHTKIIFWKFLEKNTPEEDELAGTEGKGTEKKTVPLLRYYRLFNLEQCADLRLKPITKHENRKAPGTINEQAERVLQIPSLKPGGTCAFYNRAHDFIQLPPPPAFESIEHYYATGFHETVHWTGNEARLNRTFGKRFGDKEYAFEELIAEIGAAFLGAHIGIPFNKMRHPEYIKHWIEVLKDDNKAIFTACRLAQEASEFILQKITPTETLPATLAQQPAIA